MSLYLCASVYLALRQARYYPARMKLCGGLRTMGLSKSRPLHAGHPDIGRPCLLCKRPIGSGHPQATPRSGCLPAFLRGRKAARNTRPMRPSVAWSGTPNRWRIFAPAVVQIPMQRRQPAGFRLGGSPLAVGGSNGRSRHARRSLPHPRPRKHPHPYTSEPLSPRFVRRLPAGPVRNVGLERKPAQKDPDGTAEQTVERKTGQQRQNREGAHGGEEAFVHEP